MENLARHVHRNVEIHVHPPGAAGLTTQRITVLAANLMARWARRVRVIVPALVLHANLRTSGWTRLAERIEGEMYGYRPLRRVLGGSTLLKPGHPATVAAIGVSEVFKRAVGHPRYQWVGDLTWCTWSHVMVPSVVEDVETGRPDGRRRSDRLGRSLHPGGRSVSGSIILLDRDRVETSNLNRSPLFTALNAARKLEKIEVGRRLMEGIGIATEVRAGTWHQHGATLAREGLDVWISLTNEEGAWAEIPFQMPSLVLTGPLPAGGDSAPDAWVSGTRGRAAGAFIVDTA